MRVLHSINAINGDIASLHLREARIRSEEERFRIQLLLVSKRNKRNAEGGYHSGRRQAMGRSSGTELWSLGISWTNIVGG